MPVHLIEQSVFPICHFEMKNGLADAKTFLGTGFFIGHQGFFLTAGHVALAASAAGIRPGIFFKPDPIHQPLLNAVAWSRFEIGPSDLAIGMVDIKGDRFFDGLGSAADIWSEIATCGYPESSTLRDGDRFQIPLSGLRGYIKRTITDGSAEIMMPSGKIYELDFPLPRGMSGSPLYRPSPPNTLNLIGVCVATRRSSVIEYEETYVDEDGRQTREFTKQIEHYGLAVAIETALSWCPAMVGRPLGEIVS